MLTIIRKVEKFYWACVYEYYRQLCEEYYVKIAKLVCDGRSNEFIECENKYVNVSEKRKKAYNKFMELRDC